jgi:hypothetical protein
MDLHLNNTLSLSLKLGRQSTAGRFNALSTVLAKLASKATTELWFSLANDAACILVPRTTHYLRSKDTKEAQSETASNQALVKKGI